MGGGGQNQQNSPGQDCDPDDPNSPCNTGGPGACQQTPNCGDTEGRDCCGTRCCSFGSASSTRPGVHCWCSECPPWPTCSDFCEAYLKANGEPGPGCAEGRDGNSCDSCSVCESGECVKDTFSPPCWCEGEGCNTNGCYKCNTDPESFDYGDCEFDGSNCQQCATIRNHMCPCGRLFTGPIILPDITVCKAYGAGGLLPINLAQQKAVEMCNELCKGEPADPCKPRCSTPVRCTDTGTGVLACKPGETQVGSIESGGEMCLLCEACDYSGLPDSCKECDCNCNDDCPSCQLCGADGTCYPDPACENKFFREIAYSQEICDQGYNPFVGCTMADCPANADFVSTIVAQRDGEVGVDDIGYQWRQAYKTPVTNCIYCPNLDDRKLTEDIVSELYLNGVATGTTTYSQRVECGLAGLNNSQIQYRLGVAVGFGDTPSEAYDDAISKLPSS